MTADAHSETRAPSLPSPHDAPHDGEAESLPPGCHAAQPPADQNLTGAAALELEPEQNAGTGGLAPADGASAASLTTISPPSPSVQVDNVDEKDEDGLEGITSVEDNHSALSIVVA